MNTCTARWLAVAVVIAAIGVLGMGVIMALAMTDMGGHMRGGSGGSPQTPATFDTAEVAIEIRDFDYFPRDATVSSGASVTWTNFDGAPHTATDKDGAWDTGRLDKNDATTLSFDEPGEYEYYCIYHPNMKATLKVR